MIYAVIMAGGSGTRFWPLSTKVKPKQFLNLFGGTTMIQNTAARLSDLVPSERVMVVTNAEYLNLVNEQLPEVPEINIVGEPLAKNTAPCVAVAAELILKKDPDAVMMVLPADHHITDTASFVRVLKTAVQKAETGPHLVTIGIEPGRPETGFGYIHAEKNSDDPVLKVKGFKEKPDKATAQQFLEAGDYFWNSGMFVWRADTIIHAFENYLPAMYTLLKEASPKLYTNEHAAAINEFYSKCESISIDYGIMERAKEVFVVPGEFGWNDVGSWTAVYELNAKNNEGNAIQCKNSALFDASNNLLVSKTDKVISVVGLDNIAVVETESAILVCNLNEAQGVKEIVEQLKTNPDYRKYL